jgi:hypothetical protein
MSDNELRIPNMLKWVDRRLATALIISSTSHKVELVFQTYNAADSPVGNVYRDETRCLGFCFVRQLFGPAQKPTGPAASENTTQNRTFPSLPVLLLIVFFTAKRR